MRTANGKKIILLMGVASVLLLPGCTNWERKYNNLQVAYNNLDGRYKLALDEKGRLAEELAQSQQTVEELKRRLGGGVEPVAGGADFGEGYAVSYDPRAGTITVTLENKILFSAGKAALKSATSAELDHIQSVLGSKYPGKQIDVVGHTDSDPIKQSPWKDNWELSAQRALSVLRYLVKRGMPEDRIRAVGCGAARPVADNTTGAGKAKNRRVEIVVYVR